MTQFVLDLGHRPALGEADFLVAPCNQQAIQWLDRWPRWPAPALTVHGPAGCGKTHLARVFAARSGAPVIAAASLATATVPAQLGTAEAAVVDDAEQAAAEALLHLHNLLAERRGHLLVTAQTPPARWPGLLPDLRSRLVAAPAVAVEAPDEPLLAALLVKLFADRQVTVGEEVVLFLARQIERSFAAARQAVAELDAAALREKRGITIPLARAVLGLKGSETG
ncbi:MAG TPA: DnaA/Hda family protein [Stellaceae bacterium]|nr:DnaA/Hda family protein [Stellaceae bacterium]